MGGNWRTRINHSFHGPVTLRNEGADLAPLSVGRDYTDEHARSLRAHHWRHMETAQISTGAQTGTSNFLDVYRQIGDIAIAVGTACKGLARRTTIDRARVAYRAAGFAPAPVGCGNGKVATASTYRGIRETCPPTCPIYDACYASEGNVNLHQMRAGGDAIGSLAAFGVAIALHVAGHVDAVRLHTSGDFGSGDDTSVPDPVYVDGLIAIAARVWEGSGTVAWTYTHLPPSIHRDIMIARLLTVGVEVLISDEIRAGGAIVMPHDLVPDLKRGMAAAGISGVHPIRCPEQTAKRLGRPEVSCAQCQLCWVGATAKGRLIVFDPIGGEARKADRDEWTPAPALARILEQGQ